MFSVRVHRGQAVGVAGWGVIPAGAGERGKGVNGASVRDRGREKGEGPGGMARDNNKRKERKQKTEAKGWEDPIHDHQHGRDI